MPKISNNDVHVFHKDINKYFKVEVFYNKKYFFYSLILVEFKTLVKHLSDEQEREFKIRYYSRSQYERDKTSPIICGNTEDECLENVRKFLTYALNATIEKRNVIIVFFDPSYECNYEGMIYDDKFEQIGMRLGLTYAVETIAGDKKVYNQYKTYKGWAEEDKERVQEIYIWNKKVVIIDDTPENRETLESIYKAFGVLIDKLKSITETPELLLQFIESKIKLLN